jgi:hypothetical protein
MTLHLKDVTICSIDCVTASLAADAINESMEHIVFGDAILLSDRVISGRFRSVQIEKLNSRLEYSRFVIEELVDYINTEFVLIVQWDGFVTSAATWDKIFLDYDYIGARWPWHKDSLSVGNGGFSLRSKRLMKEVLLNGPSIDYSLNEDEIICQSYRSHLVDKGMRFASESIADRFSYERVVPEFETFGFHGFFNMWRHCDDSKMIDILPNLGFGTYSSVEYLELMVIYLQQKKFRIYKKMYHYLLQNLIEKNIREHFSTYINDEAFIDLLVLAGQGD